MKRIHIFVVIILISIFPGFAQNPKNLVINSGFEDYQNEILPGWDNLWVREKGKGKMKIISNTGRAQGNVLKITYSGSKDWSFGQKTSIKVIPGEVYVYSGWVKCENADGSVQLSVVIRDRQDKVIHWMYGIIESKGNHEWKKIESRIIIPRNCGSIQFRITGNGEGTSFWDDLSLCKLKNSIKMPLMKPEKVSITAHSTTFSYMPGTHQIQLSSQTHTRVYTIQGFGSNFFITHIKKEKNKLIFLMQNIYDGDIIITAAIPSQNSITLSMSCKGIMNSDITFPGNILAESSQSWVIPQNEGLLVPSDDPYYSPQWRLDLYSGHGGLSMPFLGLTDGNEGIIFISETPDDNYIQFHRSGKDNEPNSSWIFCWQPQKGMWGYKRRLIIELVNKQGYVGIAKAYRNHVKAKGKFVTLKQKRTTVPAVDRLIGAADIWWWEKAESWVIDYNCQKIALELKNSGITKVLWSNRAAPDAIKKMNNLGYLTSRYDIYQDVWDPDIPFDWLNKDGWPGDLVLNKDGSWKKGWIHRINGKEYPGGIICSQKGYERMKTVVSKELKTYPYLARFIDTTTASPLHECYNPAHPLSRSGDREYKSKLLRFISNHFHLVTGSETGIDWAVPFVHYFEGMMSLGDYRLKDAGYDLISPQKPHDDFLRFQIGPYYRIPLFELVYHDCIVSFWYWGDSSNRLPGFWRLRDLFNLLYGTGPLYIMDKARWKKDKERFIDSFTTATAASKNTGYSEMLEHEFISEDHTVQYTLFENGTRVWVNFGNKKFTLKNGRIIKPEGFIIIE